MKFSSYEKKELLFAGFLISVAFAILLAGGWNAFIKADFNFVIIFLIAFLTGGLGFLLHELMHKYVAQRYGFWAEFKAFHSMLWIAVIASLFGFIFAAPGAVFIRGKITKEQNGKISLAGPVTNIVLAFIFLFCILIFGNSSYPTLLNSFFNFGLSINSLLAAFNMIPTIPFDGGKVYAWHKPIYFITLALGVGLFIVSWFV